MTDPMDALPVRFECPGCAAQVHEDMISCPECGRSLE